MGGVAGTHDFLHEIPQNLSRRGANPDQSTRRQPGDRYTQPRPPATTARLAGPRRTRQRGGPVDAPALPGPRARARGSDCGGPPWGRGRRLPPTGKHTRNRPDRAGIDRKARGPVRSRVVQAGGKPRVAEGGRDRSRVRAAPPGGERNRRLVSARGDHPSVRSTAHPPAPRLPFEGIRLRSPAAAAPRASATGRSPGVPERRPRAPPTPHTRNGGLSCLASPNSRSPLCS